MINKSIVLILVLILFQLADGQNVLISPHGERLRIACETCHTTADWNNIPKWKFNHDQTGFSLYGAHNDAECRDCHQTLVFNEIGVSCIDCHTDIHQSELGSECESCHNSRSWENRSEVMNQHALTNFPLIGVHANLDCESCHVNEQGKQFSPLSVECQSCHLTDYMKTINPTHEKVDFDLDCQNCHVQVKPGWKSPSFEHPSAFLLKGAHKMTECAACHNVSSSMISTECYSCHKSDFQSASDPNHSMFGFPTVCEECHTDVSWQRTSFDHLAESGFMIEGAHLSILCTDCHVNNQLSGLARDCIGCHQNDFTTADNPSHVQNNFSENCLDCHNVNAWQPANFDHSITQFPITGAHVSVNCADCHTTGYTRQLATNCFSCHETDFSAVADPNHVSNSFDHECQICHTTNAWQPATFDHSITQFPLTGAHVSVNCADCHTTGYTQQLPLDCYSCHEQDFSSVSEPNHVSNNFDHDCTICHSTSAWEPANFDHSGTQFPLTGAHISVNCAECHTTGYTQQLPLDCYSCHEQDFTSVSEPNHVSNNFDHDCTMCHSTNAWEPANFDHSGTEFPLTGAHINVNCADCHTAGYTQQLATDCFSCHELDFTAVSSPNHIVNNFDHDCIICHTTTAWQPATFDHSGTEFPLTGAHTLINCSACHTTGYNEQLPADCFSCHEADFNTVSDPNHVINNFDHDCMICHTTNAWEPATFNHSNSDFPLTGAHTSVDCALCHSNGYQNTAMECVACHQNDYTQTTDPNHFNAQFPTTCETCHTTVAWEPSSWDHDGLYFPIYSGSHREKWNSCADCHINATNYIQFECINCHEHNQQDMDDDHKEEPGYEYSSIRCYDCHLDGKSR